MTKNEALEPDKYYHIYNHAVCKENLFIQPENYLFFLKRYAYYLNPVVDTFAYCLMPNHFHLAVRIKPENELIAYFELVGNLKKKSKSQIPKPLRFPKPERFHESFEGKNLSVLISKQFSNLFNSYAKSFNKQQNRRGNLFEQKFKRKHINSEEYFRQLIHYIHFNPVHHQFVEDLRNWKYSSFESFSLKKLLALNVKKF